MWKTYVIVKLLLPETMSIYIHLLKNEMVFEVLNFFSLFSTATNLGPFIPVRVFCSSLGPGECDIVVGESVNVRSCSEHATGNSHITPSSILLMKRAKCKIDFLLMQHMILFSRFQLKRPHSFD